MSCIILTNWIFITYLSFFSKEIWILLSSTLIFPVGSPSLKSSVNITSPVFKSRGSFIFSSPLYFWGFSSQIKTIIDRTYGLYTKEPEHTSLVDGQRQALIATGAGAYEDNAEGMIAAFGRMQKYHKAINAGELFVGSCTTPDALDGSVQQKAIEFAKKIVG